MARWNIDKGASIDGSGEATFPINTTSEDIKYTITYTDDNGKNWTTNYTVKGSQECECSCCCDVSSDVGNLPYEGSVEGRIIIGNYSSKNCEGQWDAAYRGGDENFIYDFTFKNGLIQAKVKKNSSESQRSATYTFSIGDDCEKDLTFTQDANCDCKCSASVIGGNLSYEGSVENRIRIGTYSSENCEGEWNAVYRGGDDDFLYDLIFNNGSIEAKVKSNDSDDIRIASYTFYIGDGENDCEKDLTFTQDACGEPKVYMEICENGGCSWVLNGIPYRDDFEYTKTVMLGPGDSRSTIQFSSIELRCEDNTIAILNEFDDFKTFVTPPTASLFGEMALQGDSIEYRVFENTTGSPREMGCSFTASKTYYPYKIKITVLFKQDE